MSANQDQLLLWGSIALLAFALVVLIVWLLMRRARNVEIAQLTAERDTLVETVERVRREHELAVLALDENRKRIVELSSQRAAFEGRLERLTQVETELAAARTDSKHWNEACQRAEQQAMALGTRLQEQQQSTQEKLSMLERVREEFADRFKALAGDLLEEKSKKFTEQNQANLGVLLDPLREQLGDFRKTVTEVYDKESRERQLLKAEIDGLKTLNQRISEDAINLTHALKADSKVRGAWGEVVLERLLEMAGLQAGRQYDSQQSFAAADGFGQQRPDVIVRLPDEKDIVVDAKVSLLGWDRYASASTDEERRAGLRDHLASIRRHIDNLSNKDYSSLPGLRTLDFVLMFVPIEAAFVEAVRSDDAIYGYALAKNVSLVSPSTLLATLRTIAHLWRIEQRNVHVLEFGKVATQLHDNFASLIEGIQDVGSKLERTQNAHSGLLRRLTEGGRGSVLLQVQRLKELGISSKKNLPRELLERAGAVDEVETDAGPLLSPPSDADPDGA